MVSLRNETVKAALDDHIRMLYFCFVFFCTGSLLYRYTVNGWLN